MPRLNFHFLDDTTVALELDGKCITELSGSEIGIATLAYELRQSKAADVEYGEGAFGVARYVRERFNESDRSTRATETGLAKDRSRLILH